jgi:hypothetical protein
MIWHCDIIKIINKEGELEMYYSDDYEEYTEEQYSMDKERFEKYLEGKGECEDDDIF